MTNMDVNIKGTTKHKTHCLDLKINKIYFRF